MKIKFITKHRNNGHGIPNWTIDLVDPGKELHQWLLDTFPDNKSTGFQNNKPSWLFVWQGKQYFNKNECQYRIYGEEIMSMLKLRWTR